MELSEYEKYKKLEDLPVVTKVVMPDQGMQRKGVIQFIHGMCEIKERYDDILDIFSKKGFVCVIADLRGHGENVLYDKDLGYIGDDGANILIEDAHAITIYIKNKFPDLPITLIGHSMGALIARAYAKKYDRDIDALILLGCPTNRKFKSAGKAVIEIISMICDDHETNRLVHRLMVGSYEKKFENENLPNSWICSDKEVVEKYNETPKCGFQFTVNGYLALCRLMCYGFSKKNWQMKNKNMPVMLLSGREDPCMIDEEHFMKAVHSMKDLGYKNVTYRIYDGMRHEILNEPGRAEVLNDILRVIPKE